MEELRYFIIDPERLCEYGYGQGSGREEAIALLRNRGNDLVVVIRGSIVPLTLPEEE